LFFFVSDRGPQVDVGGGKFVHLRVYRDLQKHITLAGIQTGKTAGDVLSYF
jgi:hypothetical protein